MKCKLNRNEVEFLLQCSRNCPLFGDCLVQYEKESDKRNKPTNADRINSMTIEEKAQFLSEITCAGRTPWSDLFYEQNCKNCPTTECFMEGRTEPMQLHECDFADGKCPHGDEIMWWLQQPSEV